MFPHQATSRRTSGLRDPSPVRRSLVTLALSPALVPALGCNSDGGAREAADEYGSPAARADAAAEPARGPRVLDQTPFEAAGTASSDVDGTLRIVDRTVSVPGLDRSWIGNRSHSLHIHERPGTDHGPTLVCANL